MFRLTIAGAACALCLVASPAAAEPFRNFVDMCLDTNIDRQAAGGRAKAKGWFSLPVDPAVEDEAQLEDAALFLSVDPQTVSEKDFESLEMLLTGWGAGEQVFDVAGVRMDACVVVSPSAEAADLADRLEDMLGFGSTAIDGVPAWAFSRVGSGFRSEADAVQSADDDPEALRRLAGERKIYVAGVIEEEGMTGLMLAALRSDR